MDKTTRLSLIKRLANARNMVVIGIPGMLPVSRPEIIHEFNQLSANHSAMAHFEETTADDSADLGMPESLAARDLQMVG